MNTEPGSALHGVRARDPHVVCPPTGLSHSPSGGVPPDAPTRLLLVHMPWCPLAPLGLRCGAPPQDSQVQPISTQALPEMGQGLRVTSAVCMAWY